MNEIIVQNEEVKAILQEVLWFYDNRFDLETIRPRCSESVDDREEYVSDSFMNSIKDMGKSHEGYPDVLYGYILRDMELGTDIQRFKGSVLPLEWSRRWSDLNNRLMTALSVRTCAAAQLYPPGGYISWHNNANAPGFNLLFTWSETGDGWFDYINEDGERTRLQDRKGEWVCRYGMFGPYDQQDHPIVYHAASTDCWRITLGFIFDQSEISNGIQEFVIEELTTP